MTTEAIPTAAGSHRAEPVSPRDQITSRNQEPSRKQERRVCSDAPATAESAIGSTTPAIRATTKVPAMLTSTKPATPMHRSWVDVWRTIAASRIPAEPVVSITAVVIAIRSLGKIPTPRCESRPANPSAAPIPAAHRATARCDVRNP